MQYKCTSLRVYIYAVSVLLCFFLRRVYSIYNLSLWAIFVVNIKLYVEILSNLFFRCCLIYGRSCELTDYVCLYFAISYYRWYARIYKPFVVSITNLFVSLYTGISIITVLLVALPFFAGLSSVLHSFYWIFVRHR